MLKRIKWSHFLGINLPHNKAGDRYAEKVWKEFANRLSRKLRVKPCRLIWLVTYELAPSGFNTHLHAQISGPSKAVDEREMQAMCGVLAREMRLPLVKAWRYDETRPNAIRYLFKERETSLDDDRWPMFSPNIPEILRRGRM